MSNMKRNTLISDQKHALKTNRSKSINELKTQPENRLSYQNRQVIIYK